MTDDRGRMAEDTSLLFELRRGKQRTENRRPMADDPSASRCGGTSPEAVEFHPFLPGNGKKNPASPAHRGEASADW